MIPEDGPMFDQTTTTVGSKIWSYAKWPLVIVGVVLVVIFLAPLAYGGARINIGGILGFLFGKKTQVSTKKTIAVVNAVPKDRIVEIGRPDSTGQVQVHQVEISAGVSPFRDKSIINLPTGEKVKLPEGIHDTDVESVIEIHPNVSVVRLKDGPDKIQTAGSLRDLIATMQTLKNKEMKGLR